MTAERLAILPKPKRGAECPSGVKLEQFAMAPTSFGSGSFASHVERCDECRGYVASLRAKTTEFVQMRPADRFLRQLESRKISVVAGRFAGLRSPWAWSSGLALSAAILLVVFKLVPTTSQLSVEPRWKGEQFGVYALRRGSTAPEPLTEGAKLRAGDTLRFVYTSTEPGELVILDLDGRGQATVFYPFRETRAASVQAGATEALPGSIELDDSVGVEALVAVFSTRSLDVPALVSQLRAQRASEPIRLSCPECRIEVLKVEKLP